MFTLFLFTYHFPARHNNKSMFLHIFSLFLDDFQQYMLLRVDRVSDVLDFHLLPAWKYVVDKPPARSSARLSIVKLLIQSTFQVFPSVLTLV